MVSKKAAKTSETTDEVAAAAPSESSETKTSGAKWVKLKPAELEQIIVDLGKKGMSPAKIGLVLRDMHGVPNARAMGGKKITQILAAHNIKYITQEDVFRTRTERLKEHKGQHSHDHTATKALNKHLWTVHKLERQ